MLTRIEQNIEDKKYMDENFENQQSFLSYSERHLLEKL